MIGYALVDDYEQEQKEEFYGLHSSWSSYQSAQILQGILVVACQLLVLPSFAYSMECMVGLA